MFAQCMNIRVSVWLWEYPWFAVREHDCQYAATFCDVRVKLLIPGDSDTAISRRGAIHGTVARLTWHRQGHPRRRGVTVEECRVRRS